MGLVEVFGKIWVSYGSCFGLVDVSEKNWVLLGHCKHIQMTEYLIDEKQRQMREMRFRDCSIIIVYLLCLMDQHGRVKVRVNREQIELYQFINQIEQQFLLQISSHWFD